MHVVRTLLFTMRWQFTSGGPIVSSPAVDSDGTVYVGSYDANVYALNSQNGEARELVYQKIK